MSKHNYEVGGRVQISGKWYPVKRDDLDGAIYAAIPPLSSGPYSHYPMWLKNNNPYTQFIQDYEPPKKRDRA